MLEPLFNLIDRVKQLDAEKIVINLIFKDEIRTFILDLNRQKQLYEKGEDIEGNVLGEYSAYTEEITQGRKKAGSHYTLFDTGEFYRSFDVAVYSDNSFVVEADTIKDDGTDLARKFGQDILGLSSDSKGELINKLLPLIIEQVKLQLSE